MIFGMISTFISVRQDSEVTVFSLLVTSVRFFHENPSLWNMNLGLSLLLVWLHDFRHVLLLDVSLVAVCFVSL